MLILIKTETGYGTEEVKCQKCFRIWKTIFFIRYEKGINMFIISSLETGKLVYQSINQDMNGVIKEFKKHFKDNFTKEQFFLRKEKARKIFEKTGFAYPLNKDNGCSNK